MVLGPLALGLAGLILGLRPSLIAGPVGLAVSAVTRADTAADLAIWHGLTPTLVLSVVTLAGAIGLYLCREVLWRGSWPQALRMERVYTGTLSALDALSRRISPALQSASLRSYVVTVLVTALGLQVAALATGRVLPTPRRWTPIEWYEGVVALLIVAGAMSAVVARTNMAAVLSLGAVGYGVALTYALLGAPDLAMTQFAVETLTVVIFVLVFAQLRGFGDLSSPLVRTRDAILAAAVGTLVTTLVLYIGASGTTSRLSSYFAEAAPRLAHGRNVVNVILVDFRGFDTLGETTVLVTVAIGVRALLLIGRERRP
jgi:multicomponent Na+:H+ antiporter subunit A